MHAAAQKNTLMKTCNLALPKAKNNTFQCLLLRYQSSVTATSTLEHTRLMAHAHKHIKRNISIRNDITNTTVAEYQYHQSLPVAIHLL